MSLLLVLALLGVSWERNPGAVDTRTIREAIPLEGLRSLTVDNINGAITVTADGGNDIRMVVSERLEAADQGWLERARQDLSLRIERRADRIVVCADGPFREPDDCTEWLQEMGRHQPRRMYRAVYEIELRVPRSIDLAVRTIEGDLSVTGVRGRLEVNGVQGDVVIEGAEGPAAKAGTVNGTVHVRFTGNPREDSTFSSINGEIDVVFQPDLSADFSFETMNGEILSDFDYRILPAVAHRTESRKGGTTYRLEVDSAIRIGGGGPHHRFKSINGDITIRRN